MSRVYGLSFAGEVPAFVTPENSSDAADVTVARAGERAVPAAPPRGAVLACLEVEGRLHQVTVRGPQGHTLRIPGYADFQISPQLDRVTIWTHPGTSEELLGLLFIGPLSAVLLELRGQLVLHASAVTWEMSTIAICARSGGGKSTIAGLLCAAGGKLHTDDLLRITSAPDGVALAWRGAGELRLREHAREVVMGLFPDPVSRETADGRVALTASVADDDASPLRVVAIPHLDRVGPPRIVIERLGAADAMLELASRPRLYGWRDAEILRQQFQRLARLTEQVPIITLTVPWNDRFDPSFASALAVAFRHDFASLEPGGRSVSAV